MTDFLFGDEIFGEEFAGTKIMVEEDAVELAGKEVRPKEIGIEDDADEDEDDEGEEGDAVKGFEFAKKEGEQIGENALLLLSFDEFEFKRIVAEEVAAAANEEELREPDVAV